MLPIRDGKSPVETATISSGSAGCATAAPALLLIDADKAAAAFVARLLSEAGYAVQVAHDGEAALSAIATHPPDAVVTEASIPQIDGFEICRRIKREAATRLTPVIFLTALGDKRDRIEALDAGADGFFTKPADGDELLARLRSVVRVKRYTDDLDPATSIVVSLAVMIESRDGFKEGHCHRIANYATSLGRTLQLSANDLQALHRGGFLHDIGMLTIPEPVLHKSGKLTPEEFELVKSHTIIGGSLVHSLRSLQPVEPIIRHHHERFDGSGYPDGLRGDQIPLLAQIIGLVDVYDAVTTQRPYQDAMSVEEGVAVLRAHASRGWKRPDLVEQFAKLIQNGKHPA